MSALNIVTFKWTPPQGYRSVFGPQTVNVLKRMVARHYDRPHTFTCVTDDPKGIDPDVRIVPLWNDHASLPSPHGAHNPSCYRRLRVFAPDIASVLGERFLCIDLDTVITGDLSPIFDRTEDFIIWGETDRRSFYNGSMFMLSAGARPQVWTDFDPSASPQTAKSAGKFGSDQGWISYRLGPGEATWGRQDGVYSYRVHLRPQRGKLPKNAKVVNFHGREDPWSHPIQKLAWVRECYQ